MVGQIKHQDPLVFVLDKYVSFVRFRTLRRSVWRIILEQSVTAAFKQIRDTQMSTISSSQEDRIGHHAMNLFRRYY